MSRQGVSSDLTTYLNTTDTGIEITFDSQIAFSKPNIDFINILHPLTQAISRYYNLDDDAIPNAHHVIFKTKRLQPGFYFYFVFRLRIIAARGANTLEMIILNDQIEEACSEDDAEIILGELVEQGSNPTSGLEINPNSVRQSYERAQSLFLERVENIRRQHERNNNAFIDRRLASLTTFYEKNIRKQEELLRRGTLANRQERYLRMLRGTLARLRTEQEGKISDLERQRAVEVNYDEIAAGILEVPNRFSQEVP